MLCVTYHTVTWLMCVLSGLYNYATYVHVTEFEKNWLPCMQKQDIHFTIRQLLYTLANSSGRYVLALRAAHTAFGEACFWGLSEVHKCTAGLEMAPFPLDKQAISCKLPHDWLVRLAMELAALCNVPYTWNFSRHVYFTVEHETRIFAVEISRMKVIQKIRVFMPCYKAMYENVCY